MGWEDQGAGVVQYRCPAGVTVIPSVFLIWIAPILKERVREETNLDVEMPSLVDDMCSVRISSTGRLAASRE